MLDHIVLPVSSFLSSFTFYSTVLGELGVEPIKRGHRRAGFGRNGKPEFFIFEGDVTAPGLHFAFVADDRQMVDDFYAAAMAAGATDNGAPGLRPDYHPNYYGAFVYDPDGYNIEAVCHLFEAS